MEEFWDVIVLATLQGVAEFLPISSSGHLVLAQNLLDINKAGMRLELVLHVGTLFSIILYYRKTILDLILRVFRRDIPALLYAGYIILSTLPALLFYFTCKEMVERIYENATVVGCCLILTGILLCLLKWFGKENKNLNAKRSILIGAAQAVAILPGISRSGSTIAAARLLGVRPDVAAQFSFLMSLPLLAGGALLDFLGFMGGPSVPGEALPDSLLWIGALVSAIVGYISISLLVKLLKGGYFWIFGIYCLIAGTLALVFI